MKSWLCDFPQEDLAFAFKLTCPGAASRPLDDGAQFTMPTGMTFVVGFWL